MQPPAHTGVHSLCVLPLSGSPAVRWHCSAAARSSQRASAATRTKTRKGLAVRLLAGVDGADQRRASGAAPTRCPAGPRQRHLGRRGRSGCAAGQPQGATGGPPGRAGGRSAALRTCCRTAGAAATMVCTSVTGALTALSEGWGLAAGRDGLGGGLRRVLNGTGDDGEEKAGRRRAGQRGDCARRVRTTVSAEASDAVKSAQRTTIAPAAEGPDRAEHERRYPHLTPPPHECASSLAQHRRHRSGGYERPIGLPEVDVLRPAPSVQDGITGSPTAGSMTSPAGLSLPGRQGPGHRGDRVPARRSRGIRALLCSAVHERRTNWRMPPLR